MRRRVMLSRSMADKPVELHVAADYLTALEFDSPLERDAVTLGDAGDRFALFEVNTRSIVLKPASHLATGERVLLTVPFADGMSPARAVFALVTHASEVDVQVQVSRLPRTAEAVQTELDEVRAACAGKDAELDALRARSTANGPAGMILAGLLDDGGAQARVVEVNAHGSQGLLASDFTVYQGKGWAALSLQVINSSPAHWAPTEARLSLASGERTRVLPVRMKEARIEPGREVLLVVEANPLDWPRETALQLELRDSEGTRRILLPPFVL